MRLQGVFDQLELHLLAGIAVLGFDDLDVGSGHRLLETLVARFHPTGTRRTREPGDLDLARAHGVRLGNVLARLVAHLAEGDERLGGELGRRHAVDHVDHRDALATDLGDEIVEAVEGDCADHDGVRSTGNAVLDLRDLGVEVGIAARLHELHLDSEALRLGDDAVVDSQPVGVLHVRKRNTDVPGLRSLFQRGVVDRPARAGHVERRIPDLDRVGVPLLRRVRPNGQGDRQHERSDRRQRRYSARLHLSMLPVCLPCDVPGSCPMPCSQRRDRCVSCSRRAPRTRPGQGLCELDELS